MESKLTWAAISTSSIAVQGWMVSFIQATFALLRSTCQPLAHRSSSRAFETLSAARSSSGLSPGHSAGLKASATSVTKGGGRKLAALLLRPYLPDTCFKVSGMGAVMAHGFLAGIMMCVALVSPAVGQDRAQRRGSLTGFVRDTSGQPLPLVLVTVALDTPRIGITDSAGAYRLDGIPPASVPIDSILIIGRTIHTDLVQAGFYERERQRREGAGVGRFIMPEEMDQLRTMPKTSHILEFAGVRLLQVERGLTLWPVGKYNVILRGQPGNILTGPCQMAVFVDGMELDIGLYYIVGSGQGLDAHVAPNDIRAIEVYHSASGTPIQFQSTRNAQCGSIVIWTKAGPDIQRARRE